MNLQRCTQNDARQNYASNTHTHASYTKCGNNINVHKKTKVTQQPGKFSAVWIHIHTYAYKYKKHTHTY